MLACERNIMVTRGQSRVRAGGSEREQGDRVLRGLVHFVRDSKAFALSETKSPSECLEPPLT